MGTKKRPSEIVTCLLKAPAPVWNVVPLFLFFRCQSWEECVLDGLLRRGTAPLAKDDWQPWGICRGHSHATIQHGKMEALKGSVLQELHLWLPTVFSKQTLDPWILLPCYFSPLRTWEEICQCCEHLGSCWLSEKHVLLYVPPLRFPWLDNRKWTPPSCQQEDCAMAHGLYTDRNDKSLLENIWAPQPFSNQVT